MATITPEILTEMRENAPLNWDICEVLADKHGLKTRSLVASASRNKIEYTRKAKTNKAGNPVVSKADLVEAIAEKLSVEVTSLDGLDKATKAALEVINSALDEANEETE